MKPQVITLTRHVDDRGDLCELYRFSWDIMKDGDDKTMNANQVYTVFDPAPHIIRAYHRHEHLWDLFHIASGSAKFHLIPGPREFPIKGNAEVGDLAKRFTVTLSARKPQLLVVPPLWWHGWMSLEENTLLVSIASHEYNPKYPDEERIPPGVFGPIWGIDFK